MYLSINFCPLAVLPVLILIADGDSGEGQGRDVFIPDINTARKWRQLRYIPPQHVAKQPKCSHNDNEPQNSAEQCSYILNKYNQVLLVSKY